MSHTLQAALAFPILFGFITILLCLGPQMYAQTNDTAVLGYEYLNRQSENKKIFKTGHICVNQQSADTVYTSPERLMYMLDSFRDSFSLIAEGVEGLW